MESKSLTSFILIAFFLPFTTLFGQTYSEKELNGIWQSEGYGQVINIGEQEVDLYDICSLNCIPHATITKEEFKNEFEIIKVSPTSLTIKESTTEYDFIRLENLPDLCKNQVVAKKHDPNYNFETLWTTFQEHYCYFETRNIDWMAMKAKYQSQITNKTKPLELFIIMDKMLEELNDGHATMFVPDELQKAYQKYQKKEFKQKLKTQKKKRVGVNTEVVRHALVDNYVKDKQVYNYGSVIWGMINEDLALVQINGMDELAYYNIPAEYSERKAMSAYEKHTEESKNYTQDVIDGAGFIIDQVLVRAKNAKAIILDIRLNGGGYDGAGMEILRRFIQEKKTVLTKKAKNGDGFTRSQTFTLTPAENTFSGKVFLLTSPVTASAAESFTLAAMEAIPNAIRIGDNTRGIFSDMLQKQLPNGWEFSLSNEVYESIEGVSYENIGIPPHHKIPLKKGTFWTFRQLKDDLDNGLGDQAIEMILKMDISKIK